MESQEFKELSLGIALRKNKWQDFQKIENTMFLGPFCPNLGKNEFYTNIKLSLFSICSPLTSCKKKRKKTKQNKKQKTEKVNEPLWEKLLTKEWANEWLKKRKMNVQINVQTYEQTNETDEPTN